jgi:glycosyltransferase involved in cell wall biosynthesis
MPGSSKTKVKVIYDISVLGLAHSKLYARAGIFRVIDRVARGLHVSKDCDLYFCATAHFDSIDESLAYLENDAELGVVPLPHPKFRRWFAKKVRSLNDQIDRMPSPANFALRAIRRPLLYADKLIGPYVPIAPEVIDQADIFHSTYHAIPEQAAKARDLKKFLTVYDLIPILYPQYCKDGLDDFAKQILQSAGPEDGFICISNATRDDLCNYRRDIVPSRVFVAYPAASDLFHPCRQAERISQVRRKYGIPDGPYMLSLSTLEPRKNIPQTIRCFARVIHEQRLKDLNLVLVGTKGWKYQQIFETLSNCKPARSQIILTGYVPDQDLAPLYSGAQAFIYPSFYEGFGLPPLEAMQCGTPVITSKNSSLPEVVGEAGIMLDPTDEDSLCQSMLELYQNQSLRRELSIKSLKQAEKFTWDKCVQATVTAYKTVVAR